MGGVKSIFMALYGVFWTVIAASMGAVIMMPFGFIFIGIAVVNALYNFKNATGENRYSSFDIVDHTEESDPLNDKFGKPQTHNPETQNAASDNKEQKYCPYCGAKVGADFIFCNSCGKKQPK